MGNSYFNMLRSILNSFTPASLFSAGEIGFWFDPSDLSTMFQDVAGTIPVTSVGQSVALILDKSGNNNHAIQATSAARPILGQDAQSRYRLEFNGSKYLSITNLNFSSTDEFSSFSAVRREQNITEIIFEHSANSTLNNGSFEIIGTIPGQSILRSVGTTGVNFTFNVGTAPVDLVVYGAAKISAPLIEVIVNNGSKLTNSSNQGTGNYGTYPFFIGSRGGASLFFTGSIYGFVLRGKLSTTEEIQMSRNYMNSKIGAY